MAALTLCSAYRFIFIKLLIGEDSFCHCKSPWDKKEYKYTRIMFLDSAKKKEIFEKYGKSATNTGSAESQIALFTVRIAHLTEHLKANHKDHSSERALKMLVGKRRRLLDYLIKVDIERYRAIIKELGIRK